MISASDIRKAYGDTLALDGLTVEVPKGAVGLLGPNGAGKSTFIRIILGLVKPDAGSVSVLGYDISRQPLEVRARIGYMPEHDCLRPDMDAVDFLSYMGELGGMSRLGSKQRAHETLEYVGIDDERYRKIKTYSTGMKQKVKLAAALVADPDLLILDEPTSGMDSTGRKEILDLITDIVSHRGMSMLLSSHLLPDIEKTCGDVVVMASGKVVLEGHIDELTRHSWNAYEVRTTRDLKGFAAALAGKGLTATVKGRVVVVEGTGDDILDVIFRTARETENPVRMLSDSARTLEDVFMQTVGRNA